jgi:SAM-dependent methyltransferase
LPNASTTSYESIPEFGELYDNVPAYATRRDVQFYVEEAGQAEGAVLEVGCGTGRILLPLARAGHEVVGVDTSAQMLARCRAKLLDEAEPVRDRVRLHHGDARTLALGERFSLIIAPFRVVQHLTSIDDQLGFLHAVASHLEPGGRFIFDVFNPNFAALAAVDGIEREDTPEQRLPDGRSFRRGVRIARVRWIDQVSEVELIYYVSAIPGAPPQRHVQAFDMRWYLRSELEHLLERSGFRIEAAYGDFDRSPLIDGSPEQVVSATLR